MEFMLTAVGCCNAQIQNWDIETGVLKGSVLGHTKEVHTLQVASSCIISGSGDCSVRIWDRASNRCASVLRGHNGSVMTVKVSLFKSIMFVFPTHHALILNLQYDEDYRIMSGSYDKSVKVWDIRSTSRALATIGGQQHSAVFCLQFDDRHLVTGSADYIMRVFDLGF